MAHPTKKGEAFEYNGSAYTVKAFHGRDGVFYDTLSECKKARSKDLFILVVPSQTGGGIDVLKTRKLT